MGRDTKIYLAVTVVVTIIFFWVLAKLSPFSNMLGVKPKKNVSFTYVDDIIDDNQRHNFNTYSAIEPPRIPHCHNTLLNPNDYQNLLANKLLKVPRDKLPSQIDKYNKEMHSLSQ